MVKHARKVEEVTATTEDGKAVLAQITKNKQLKQQGKLIPTYLQMVKRDLSEIIKRRW